MSATILAFPKKNVEVPTKPVSKKNKETSKNSLDEKFNHSLFLKSSWGNNEVRLFELNHQTQEIKIVFKHTKKIRILEYIIKNYDLDKTQIPFID